jgi:hypothetical protein
VGWGKPDLGTGLIVRENLELLLIPPQRRHLGALRRLVELSGRPLLPLAQYGYNRNRKRGKLQIVCGLLCAPDGCPVAIEVFEGSTPNPTTLTSQVTKLKERFGLDHVVLVGDRGMITQARITEDLTKAGLDWITALRAPAIKALRDAGALQMSLFDERDMASITSPAFPGERLIVCRNQALAAERARKREDLLAATERELARIAEAVARKRQPLRGAVKIGLEVGAVLNKHKMAKHFTLDITDGARRQDPVKKQSDQHDLQQRPGSGRGRLGREDDVPAQRAERARRQQYRSTGP